MGSEAPNFPVTNWGLLQVAYDQQNAYNQQFAQGLQQTPLEQQQLLNQLGAIAYQYPAGMAQAPVQFDGFFANPERFARPTVDSKAEEIAEDLLLRHLNDEQKTSWGKHKGFWTTAKSGRRYWLDGQRPRGISEDGPPQSFCIYSMDETGSHLPKGDQILAQKLLIETDEERFLQTANASRL